MSMSNELWSGRRLHFVGVGGAGMSGYARAAHALGAQVSGIGQCAHPYLQRLAAMTACSTLGSARTGERDRGGGRGGHLLRGGRRRTPSGSRRRAGIAERSRAELLGELSALTSHDRGGGHAR